MWFREISKDSDVVISTRLRYARNVNGYKFPSLMNKKEKQDLLLKLNNSIDKNNFDFFKVENIDETTLGSLVEEHLISKELVSFEDTGLIIDKDSKLVVMINEEDHLRIQSFESGFNIDKCYKNLCEFTDLLKNNIEFAVSDKYGYITACPTNIGAAMRVSVMLHLPALSKLGLLSKIIDEATSMGLSVRGLYGENTSGYGHIYQISNRQTLGISDKEIITKTKAVICAIIAKERKAREVLKENSIYLDDEIYRALGILQNARMISDDEALKLLSKVRLGVAMQIIEKIPLKKIQSLMVDTLPNTLKLVLKYDLSKEEEEIKRAEYIRRELK